MEQSVLNVSLKEYKKSIDDLKASLLGLDSTSSEYAKIADEIKQRQDKLNEVMKVGKTQTDAAKGSYNALTQEMNALKQAWKATADETERAKLGEKILAINNELKGLDAGIGNFQRNVGDYANAFSSAFSTMGVSVKGLGPAFNLATAGASGFSKILNVLKAHPFIAVVTALVGIVLKLKDAISKNEESSKKWKVAMSAFQPIMNAITNAIDWLAGKMADVMLWVSKNLPSAVTFVGNAMKTIGKYIGGVVDVVLWLPKQIFPVFRKIQEGIVGLIGGAVKAGAKLLDALGFDETAAKLTGFVNMMETGLSKVNDFIENGINNAGSYVENLFNSMGKGLQNFSVSMETSMKKQREMNQLNDDLRVQNEKNAESELKQAELREKINSLGNDKLEEKKKLLQELNQEIKTNGEENLKLAKKQSEMAEYYATLTPNSKEDNDRLSQLRVNVTKTAATVKMQAVSVQKMLTKTEDKIANETAKATEKIKGDSKKAAEERKKAEAEAIKKVLEEEKKASEARKAIVKKTTEEIAQITAKQKTDLDFLKQDDEMAKLMGKYDYKYIEDQENKRHEIVQKSLDDQVNAINEALAKAELQGEEAAEEVMQLNIRLGNITLEHIKEINQHKINEEKNYQDEMKRIQDDAIKNSQRALAEANEGTVSIYSQKASEINDAFTNGEITAKEYQDKMKVLNEQYEKELKENQDTANAERLDALENYYNELLAKFGENDQRVLDARMAFENAQTEVLKKGIEDRNKELEKEATNQIKINEQKKKNQTEFAKTTASLLGIVASAYKDNIEQQIKDGKMSEKEGEKRFEAVKSMQRAQTIINTAMGVQAAIASVQSMGPWGWALGVAQAASVLASGLAQLQTINNTDLSSSGSDSLGGGGYTVSAGASPLINEELDSRSLDALTARNTRSEGDSRVYILEEDIQKSNDRVEVRESNSTF